MPYSKNCQFCGEEILRTAHVCKHCKEKQMDRQFLLNELSATRSQHFFYNNLWWLFALVIIAVYCNFLQLIGLLIFLLPATSFLSDSLEGLILKKNSVHIINEKLYHARRKTPFVISFNIILTLLVAISINHLSKNVPPLEKINDEIKADEEYSVHYIEKQVQTKLFSFCLLEKRGFMRMYLGIGGTIFLFGDYEKDSPSYTSTITSQ